MQGDRNACAPRGEVRHGAHVVGVIAQGDGVVFGGDKVERHHPRVGLDQLDGRGDLRKHLLARRGTNHLHDVAHRHPAARRGVGRVAAEEGAHSTLLGVEASARCRDEGAELGLGQSRTEGGEVVAPTRGAAQASRAADAQRLHRLEVPGVLIGEARDGLGEHVAGAARQGVEGREGGEEVVVPGAQGGREIPHRKRVDEGVAERPIGREGLRRGHGPCGGVAGRLHEGRGASARAQPVFNRPAQVRLGVHRPAQVRVQVGPFGHVAEEVGLTRGLSVQRREVPRRTRRG